MNGIREQAISNSDLERLVAVVGGSVREGILNLEGPEGKVHIVMDAYDGSCIVVSPANSSEEARIGLKGRCVLERIDSDTRTAFFSSKGGMEFSFNSDGLFKFSSSAEGTK